MPIYDCESITDLDIESDNIEYCYESEIRLATPDEIMEMNTDKYNL